MDYEKKYKEALELARVAAFNGHQSLMESIFPELKESEDEKIRKDIIFYIKAIANNENISPDSKKECKTWIAWLEKQGTSYTKRDVDDAYLKGISDAKNELEKQGEQKPIFDFKAEDWYVSKVDGKIHNIYHSVDKVGPKFKVGDWIINRTDATIMQIISNKDFYESVEIGGQRRTDSYNYVEWDFRLWTIADAMEGEVLATEDNCICIFDNTVEEGKYPFAYCGLSMYGFKVYDRTLPFTHDNVYPATKEQRDLLFQKMKEASYEWDAEKKELKKIEQKPAWSEEDERNLEGIIDEIEANKNGAPDYDLATYDRFLSWLKSLKQRIGG